MALACYFQAPLKRVQATDAADTVSSTMLVVRVIGRNKYVGGMSWWYKLLHRYLGMFSFCNDEWKAEVEIWHRRQASSRPLLPSLTFIFHSRPRKSFRVLSSRRCDKSCRHSGFYRLLILSTLRLCRILLSVPGDLPTATTGPPP